MREELCEQIASGKIALDQPELREHLRAITMDRLAIDQPSYSAYLAAVARSGAGGLRLKKMQRRDGLVNEPRHEFQSAERMHHKQILRFCFFFLRCLVQLRIAEKSSLPCAPECSHASHLPLTRAKSRAWPVARHPTVNGEPTYKFYRPSPGGCQCA